MKWDPQKCYECHGQVKYSGISTGTGTWRSGSLVITYQGSQWKLDVHLDCARQNRFSSVLTESSIVKVINKAQIVLTMRQLGSKDSTIIYFKPLNTSSACLGKMRAVQGLLEDIKNGMFAKDSGYEIGKNQILAPSPVRQPQIDVFTSMKDFNGKSNVLVSSDLDTDDCKENKNRGPSVQDSNRKNFLQSASEKSRNCLKTVQTSGFYKTDTSRSYGTFANYSNLNKRSPGLMPNPTPTKRPRLSSDVGFSWNKPLIVEPPNTQTPAVPQNQSKGFSNIGNTCYMNAILQSLFALDTFSADLLRANFRMTKAFSQHSLYHALTRLLRSRNKHTSDISRREMLRSVKSAISSTVKRFSGYQQHDAHEFLGQVLDQLKEEILKVMKSTPSPRRDGYFTDLAGTQEYVNPTVQNFEMEVLHTITCLNCREYVTNKETFNDLSVDIPRSRNGYQTTIQRSMDSFFRPEKIEYACEKCGCSNAEVTHKFTKLPRVLILHLKRYSFDQKAACQSKMGQSIKITKFLTLQSLCDEDTRPPFPAILNLPSETKQIDRENEENTPGRRRLELSDSAQKIRFRKSKPLPPLDEVDGDLPATATSTPHRKHKIFDLGTKEDNNHIKADFSLIIDDESESKEESDLAKALELSLKESVQQVSDVPSVEEDQELARVMELSLKEANQHHQSLNGTDLCETDEDKELARALELSLKEANQQEEKDFFEMSSYEDDKDLVTETDGQKLENGTDGSEVNKIEEEKPVRNDKGELPYSYRLVSIVNHVGSSSIAGHYICDIFDIKKNSWFSCNDSHVDKMMEDDVFLRRQRSGYIFFYICKDIFEDLKDHFVINQRKSKS